MKVFQKLDFEITNRNNSIKLLYWIPKSPYTRSRRRFIIASWHCKTTFILTNGSFSVELYRIIEFPEKLVTSQRKCKKSITYIVLKNNSDLNLNAVNRSSHCDFTSYEDWNLNIVKRNNNCDMFYEVMCSEKNLFCTLALL